MQPQVLPRMPIKVVMSRQTPHRLQTLQPTGNLVPCREPWGSHPPSANAALRKRWMAGHEAARADAVDAADPPNAWPGYVEIVAGR